MTARDPSIDIHCNNIILIIDKMMSHDNRKGLERKVRYQEYKYPSLFIRCILFRDNDNVIIELLPLSITGRNQIVPAIEWYIERAYPDVEVRINPVISKSKPVFTIQATSEYSLQVYDMNYFYEII